MFGKNKKDDEVKKSGQEVPTTTPAPSEATNVSEGKSDDPAMDEVYAMWLRGEEELSSVFPDFDFATAMTDEAFAGAVNQGYSLPMAFIIARKANSEVKAKPERISENGSMRTATNANTGTDPATLPKKEFDAYIKKIKNA